MRTLAIDIETYSDIDIKKAGVYAYAGSTAFTILLFAYRYDDEEVKLIDLTETKTLPQSIIDDLNNPNIIKTAYNANFERVCLSKFLNIKIPIDEWRCTAVQASMLGLPNNLKDVAKVLNLESQKDSKGTRLINYFSVPYKGQRRMPSEDSVKWEEFKSYCIQDVKVESAIRDRLSKYPISDSEQELYIIDQIINDRGIKVDEVFVDNAIRFDAIHTDICKQAFNELTGGVNPKSSTQIKEYLINRGLKVSNVDKSTIADIIKDTDDKGLKQILDLKLKLGKTSVKKYEAMKRCTCSDGRIRGLLQFYGANRTGRWAGRLVQVHNLPQNHLDNLEDVRGLIVNGDG
ncbi:Putative DNA-directed DNA polymerase, partial [Candidatus Arthromitus sp. SFB-2]